jgi:predicted lipid-binding transport protein (Tim44 family)
MRSLSFRSPVLALLIAFFFCAGVPAWARGGGGCFLPETPVMKADRATLPISQIKAGDKLLAFTTDGKIVVTTVRKIITHEVDEYLILKTAARTLRVTSEHPFYVGDGTFKTLQALRVGDSIYCLDGDVLRPERIESLTVVHEKAIVYNLQTDHPNTYFASGVAVHNKGGGGGHFSGIHIGGGWHYSRSSININPVFIVLFFAVVLMINLIYKKSLRHQNENLDFCYSRRQIAPKLAKTTKLLEFIAKVDPEMQPANLTAAAQSTFVTLQQCWQSRKYSPMKELLMDGLYSEHCSQIKSLIHNHEINMIENLEVLSVDIVNVRYTTKESSREFTALVTASACDYYVDDRTERFLRGDRTGATFQEFWTFQRQDGKWLLRTIEQSREATTLKDENFFEEFTDTGRDMIYDKAAGQAGPAGPWTDRASLDKETNVERLLNFLVQSDPLFDKASMIEKSRSTFLSVMLGLESADLSAMPEDALFPEIRESLRVEIERLKAEGESMEFRNLCVRKVELVLVQNFSDKTKDEFTVRISAHAQQFLKKSGKVLRSDEDVTPIVVFWAFGRMENAWRLKAVLTDEQGRKAIGSENTEEGSSQQMLQWYYRQTRAL